MQFSENKINQAVKVLETLNLTPYNLFQEVEAWFNNGANHSGSLLEKAIQKEELEVGEFSISVEKVPYTYTFEGKLTWAIRVTLLLKGGGLWLSFDSLQGLTAIGPEKERGITWNELQQFYDSYVVKDKAWARP